MIEKPDDVSQEDWDKKKSLMLATIKAEDQILTRRMLFKMANPFMKEEEIANQVIKPLWWANLADQRGKNRKTIKMLMRMPTPLNMVKKDEEESNQNEGDTTSLPNQVGDNL